MSVAYVDTSCLAAVAFDEPGVTTLSAKLRRCERLLASNLLEAELRAALVREGVTEDGMQLMSWVTWVYPNRSLGPEFTRVLAHGYVRGADLWHLACALFLVNDPSEIVFATLDRRQGEVAAALGFQLL